MSEQFSTNNILQPTPQELIAQFLAQNEPVVPSGGCLDLTALGEGMIALSSQNNVLRERLFSLNVEKQTT